jgi:alpha-L-rhamnosidase
MTNAPHRLRVEHLDEPLGIDARRPRLSWKLPEQARRQHAYRIRAGEWDSGRVASDRSLLVPYDGPALACGQRVSWAVKVWTDAGESDWSEPAWWEMGLLEPGDWVARWVEAPERSQGDAAGGPAQVFRHDFAVARPPARARLYATAHGIYEFFINGRRVGDLELTPGYTSYGSILQVQTFDVTELIGTGTTVCGAIVSDGWFRGQNGYFRRTGVYGDRLALLAQLHLYDENGTLTRVATGPGWRAGTGAIRAADLMQGQCVDFAGRTSEWDPAADLREWAPVTVADHSLTRLRASPAPPVRRVEELRPVAITRPAPDRQVVDLGQNVNGWIRLGDLGPAGTKLTLTHGEALDASGDVTLDNVLVTAEEQGPRLQAIWDLRHLAAPFQVDHVTSAGAPGAAFEPRHTTHGFQYVRIEGHPEELTPDEVTGVFVHTDMPRTGWFQCSDERIERLHEAAVRSFRGNACDLPVDCPTRERAGWTGDWQLFVPTAAFLYDVAGFSAKWLRDLAAEQRPDGVVQNCAPEPNRDDDIEDYPFTPGSAGWGDAAVIVPWEIYRAYGDADLLAEQWDSMVAWVDFAARSAREGRHPARAAARPEPAPHEAYVWDTGNHWGEWLEPGDPLGDEAEDWLAAHRKIDQADVATAFLHRSALLLGRAAAVLGRDDDAARYGELAANAKAAWQAEFIDPEGRLARDTQATHVRALAFDLVPDALRPQVAARLVELVREAGTHLSTGFLATPDLLPVLVDTGHADVAFELLYQDTEPSWLTMIDRGATTIWELWDGIDERGVASGSLNHYSKGAVVSFLHRYVAGIRLLDAPAYRRFEVAPLPGGGITWARAAHESPYGRIEASWRIEGDRFLLDVVVPPGTTADVRLPDGQAFVAEPGSASYVGRAPGA